MPRLYRDVNYFFDIGGYGAAKSYAVVLSILDLAVYYNGHQVTVGLGSVSIVFFMKTIGSDLEKLLITSGIKYKFDGKENCYQIGTVKFYVIPIEQPKNIFGYSYNCFFEDEGDELDQTKCIEAFSAISERCRVPFPAVTREEQEYKKRYEERMDLIPREQWDNDELILEWKNEAHRKPYAVFTSTAQGLKGLWRVVCTLQESGIPHIIIRALTKDNIYNDPAYYKRLYDLYTPKEREAYLEGRFVSLSAGRCYPQFDPTICTIDDFPIEDTEEVVVGQDLNLGASCATAFIVRDKVMYAVKEFCFDDFSQSAQIIRRSFPTNKITVWPDASGKFIMSGFTAELYQNNIELRTQATNPPIQERILLINKLFGLGRLKVFKSLKQSIMAWNTRAYDDSGKPTKKAPHPQPDDYMDSSEYATYRIAGSDPGFYDIFNLISNHGR
jgi:hypothetical protein